MVGLKEDTCCLSYWHDAYLKEPGIILFFNHSTHPEPWLLIRVCKLLFRVYNGPAIILLATSRKSGIHNEIKI